MKTATRRLPLVPIALAATLLAAFLVLFAPLSASAHDALVSSSPESGSSVETLPSELVLTFSGELLVGEGATEVVVTDASGASVAEGEPTTSGSTVTQPLAANAQAGEYRVVWKVVSSDGHPISEDFFFTVTTATDSAGASPTPDETPSDAPATDTAAPTPVASAPTATPAPTSEQSGPSAASAWIWVLSIGGILAIVALIVWYSLRARSNGAAPGDAPDSEGPAER